MNESLFSFFIKMINTIETDITSLLRLNRLHPPHHHREPSLCLSPPSRLLNLNIVRLSRDQASASSIKQVVLLDNKICKTSRLEIWFLVRQSELVARV